MTTDMPTAASKPRTVSVTRHREADAMRQLLADAKQALSQLYTAWGLWADSVRQDAEARQGVPAGADLAADREYWPALDAGSAIEQAKTALSDVEAQFRGAEPSMGTPEGEASASSRPN